MVLDCRSPLKLVSVLAGITGSLGGPLLAQPAEWTTLAASGQAPPGFPAPVLYVNFFDPQIASDGVVGFGAQLSDVGGVSTFMGTPGSLQRFVAIGDPVPSYPDGTGFVITTTSCKLTLAAGRHARLGGYTTSGLQAALNGLSGAPVSLIAGTGRPAPGTGANFGTLIPSYGIPGGALTDSGHVAQRSALSDGTIALFVGTPDLLWPIARSGQWAVGFEAGVTFFQFNTLTGSEFDLMNDVGRFAFQATVTGSGLAANTAGIWTGTDSALQLIVQTDQPAPGLPVGTTFGTVLAPTSINNGGEIVFTATLTGPAVTAANDESLWVWDGAALVLLAREGELIPGALPGQRFETPVFRAAINNAGVVAFDAQSSTVPGDSTPRRVVVRGDASSLSTVMNRSDYQPFILGLNDAGQVLAELRQTGNPTGLGLSLVSPAGDWRDILGRGQGIIIGSGVTRWVGKVLCYQDELNNSNLRGGRQPSGPSDGRPKFINNAGQIVATFRENSAWNYVLITTTIAPPACPCVADFNHSGGTPDASDIDTFFAAWLTGAPGADADCSGGTTDTSDIDQFFQEWLAGGC